MELDSRLRGNERGELSIYGKPSIVVNQLQNLHSLRGCARNFQHHSATMIAQAGACCPCVTLN
jgi:hypothetical protein